VKNVQNFFFQKRCSKTW